MKENKIRLHVWGDYACFTRPELKVERMSYEVMTPSAARGILSAIYWKPQFNWVIDCIHVLEPIRFTQIRRNELSDKVVVANKDVRTGQKTAALGTMIEDVRQQRAATILRDVSYVIEAHIEIVAQEAGVNGMAKHHEIFARRASKGQCFTQPCLGTREFPAMFELLEYGTPMPPSHLGERDKNRPLGLMLHDMVYADCPKKAKDAITVIDHAKSTEQKQAYKTITASPKFFMAELVDACLHVPSLNNALS
ncbi:MAG: type I-C CRISPR-associated protein Cas5c [Akkermansia sp.]